MPGRVAIQDLDRDGPVEARLSRLVDPTHRPVGDQSEDLIPGDLEVGGASAGLSSRGSEGALAGRFRTGAVDLGARRGVVGNRLVEQGAERGHPRAKPVALDTDCLQILSQKRLAAQLQPDEVELSLKLIHPATVQVKLSQCISEGSGGRGVDVLRVLRSGRGLFLNPRNGLRRKRGTGGCCRAALGLCHEVPIAMVATHAATDVFGADAKGIVAVGTGDREVSSHADRAPDDQGTQRRPMHSAGRGECPQSPNDTTLFSPISLVRSSTRPEILFRRRKAENHHIYIVI